MVGLLANLSLPTANVDNLCADLDKEEELADVADKEVLVQETKEGQYQCPGSEDGSDNGLIVVVPPTAKPLTETTCTRDRNRGPMPLLDPKMVEMFQSATTTFTYMTQHLA